RAPPVGRQDRIVRRTGKERVRARQVPLVNAPWSSTLVGVRPGARPSTMTVFPPIPGSPGGGAPLAEQPVPLVDLRAAQARLRAELDAAMAAVVDRASFVMGPEGGAFEAGFAAFCGTRRAVGVASGTAALHLALRALGVGRGDEVVPVAHTFAATAEAIGHAGARPRFVDVDEATGGMDPKALAGALDGAAAVLPVHLY